MKKNYICIVLSIMTVIIFFSFILPHCSNNDETPIIDSKNLRESTNCTIENLTGNVSYTITYLCYVGEHNIDKPTDFENDIRCSKRKVEKRSVCNPLGARWGVPYTDGYKPFYNHTTSNETVSCSVKRCCEDGICFDKNIIDSDVNVLEGEQDG